MNLKTMLAPAIMGMAFMGLMSTVNVAVADELDDLMNELNSLVSQSTETPPDDTASRTPCERCAGNVARAIRIVGAASNVCNGMENLLNVWREQCKQAKGIVPSSPFKDKCDVVKHGRYSDLLEARQFCRDTLERLVEWRNGVEHSCYGEPLYCGMDPNWPY
ncbi:hypothetical protein THII_2516 [Thioploca ingrica]|uniref:Uncharacterized protein n=1 Tax=Thioploca ingrica TaxID=40754 RepID=A0A090AFF1_9GAMM|nr:hypothetical protein THII_2516 [Thioploca ingrica]